MFHGLSRRPSLKSPWRVAKDAPILSPFAVCCLSTLANSLLDVPRDPSSGADERSFDVILEPLPDEATALTIAMSGVVASIRDAETFVETETLIVLTARGLDTLVDALPEPDKDDQTYAFTVLRNPEHVPHLALISASQGLAIADAPRVTIPIGLSGNLLRKLPEIPEKPASLAANRPAMARFATSCKTLDAAAAIGDVLGLPNPSVTISQTDSGILITFPDEPSIAILGPQAAPQGGAIEETLHWARQTRRAWLKHSLHAPVETRH